MGSEERSRQAAQGSTGFDLAAALDPAAAEELDERGLTVIRDLLSPQQVSDALAALKRLFDDGHAEDQHKDIMYTMNLTARDPVFRDVVQLPRLVALISHLLGEDYILSDVVSLTPLPGNEPQNLCAPYPPTPPQQLSVQRRRHRDGGNIDHIVMCNVVISLVAFNESNGVT